MPHVPRAALSTRQVAATVLHAVYRSHRVAKLVDRKLDIDRRRAATASLRLRQVCVCEWKKGVTLRNVGGAEIVIDTLTGVSTFWGLHQQARAWLGVTASDSSTSVRLVYLSSYRGGASKHRGGEIIRCDDGLCLPALSGAVLQVIANNSYFD